MSRYTTQVRWIVENMPDSLSTESIPPIPEEVPTSAIGAYSRAMKRLQKEEVLSQIILEDPFRNKEDWKRIGAKIITHYYMKEIGYETVASWLMALNARLNLIMPYYNQLLDSVDKMKPIDYFTDIDSKEQYDGSGSDRHSMQKGSGTDTHGETHAQTESSGHSNLSGTDHTLNSDTPQANYKTPPLDYATNLQDTERTETNQTGANQSANGTEETHRSETGTQNDEGTKTEQFIRKRTGMSGSRSYMELLQQYRDTLLNIDEQIVLELDDLFLRIY